MLIDSHLHYDSSGDALKILKALEITESDACCLQSQIDTKKINQNFDCFYAKLLCKNKVYINGALNASYYYHQELMDQMPEYIERMLKCGIDGIKMIEGKPTERKLFPIPNFDDPIFDATFAYLEEKRIPITWHVNDPEEFWDETLVPDWARRSGWFYADGTFVNNLEQYQQIANLLKKHPNLVITFAHFYFLSNDLKTLATIFDTYPNVSVDLTPGVEMYTNMSNNIDEARTFFKKYPDRIIYGSDISVDQGEINHLNEKDAMTRKNLCHEFLTKKEFTLKGDPNGLLGKDDLKLNGLNLDQALVEMIEAKNFLKRYACHHPLNIPLILEEIKIHRRLLKEHHLDDSYLDKIEKAFLTYHE